RLRRGAAARVSVLPNRPADVPRRPGDAGFAAGGHGIGPRPDPAFDQGGWNPRLVDGKWIPTFPNARYLFGRKEYEHWMMLKETGGYHNLNHMYDAVQPVVDAGLVDLIEPDHVICPALTLRPTPGHTPGHVSIVIESKGERAIVT